MQPFVIETPLENVRTSAWRALARLVGVDAEAEDVVVYAEEEAPVEALPMPSATIAAKWDTSPGW